MITEELKKLYTVHTGHEPETIDELPLFPAPTAATSVSQVRPR